MRFLKRCIRRYARKDEKIADNVRNEANNDDGIASVTHKLLAKQAKE